MNTPVYNRRQFNLLGTGAAVTLGSGVSSALAQAGFPVEGKHYVRMGKPMPVAVTGKVELLEFFWYACPHCAALDPDLNRWLKTLPADVAFRRVPVGFRPTHEFHARLFYAIEAMGAPESIHAKVFTAIHGEHKSLSNDEQVAAFAPSIGLDGAKLVGMMKSFAVAGKASAAKKLTQDYGIDGVPTLAVQGRYYTSVSHAGSPEALFQVLNALIAQARKDLR